MSTTSIISKVWNFCNTLRDDGVGSRFLKDNTFRGNEIVQSTRRLALMNMFLHNIGDIAGESMISSQDALIASSPENFDYVLANPPFGKKSYYQGSRLPSQEKNSPLSLSCSRSRTVSSCWTVRSTGNNFSGGTLR